MQSNSSFIVQSCNHHRNQDTKQFCHTEKVPHAPFHHLMPLATANLFSIPLVLKFPGFSVVFESGFYYLV